MRVFMDKEGPFKKCTYDGRKPPAAVKAGVRGEQTVLLRQLGCGMGQGYLLARPTPAETIQTLLASGRPLPTAPAETSRTTDRCRTAG